MGELCFRPLLPWEEEPPGPAQAGVEWKGGNRPWSSGACDEPPGSAACWGLQESCTLQSHLRLFGCYAYVPWLPRGAGTTHGRLGGLS